MTKETLVGICYLILQVHEEKNNTIDIKSVGRAIKSIEFYIECGKICLIEIIKALVKNVIKNISYRRTVD